eukprot:jgi/Mesvir1/9747/Mv12210-RA.1
MSRANIYGLKYKARCIASQRAHDTVNSRFLIGTLSLREDNELHLVEYKSERDEIVCVGLYSHKHEVWDIAPSTFDPALVTTVYNDAGTFGAAVWRLPMDNVAARDTGGTLTKVVSLTRPEEEGGGGGGGVIKCSLWHPRGDRNSVLTVEESHLRKWSLAEGREEASSAGGGAGGGSLEDLQRMSCGRWDTHDVNSVATASETSVSLWDLRTMTRRTAIANAHVMQVRDVDFNPKREHMLLTCGDDCRICFWDMRHPSAPLQEVTAHSHWVWRARYNPHHDQLVLSSGTDSIVNVYRALSLSSEAPPASALRAMDNEGGHSGSSNRGSDGGRDDYDPYDDDEGGIGMGERDMSSTSLSSMGRTAESERPYGLAKVDVTTSEGLVQVYDEHEESVYGIAWSQNDPWAFASLSYDGRVVVNTVPSETKYNILL